MLDLTRMEQAFQTYGKQFDLEDINIKRKYYHSLRVMENCKKIAEALFQTEEEKKLLVLIGYLHDIGRFKQFSVQHSSFDNKKMDHAEYGVKVLFDENVIEDFIDTHQYDEIIKKAIFYHNKMELPSSLTKQEEIYCKAIKDADKLDLFYLASHDPHLNNFYELPYVEGAKLSPLVKQEFDQRHLVTNSHRQTALDKLAAILAFVYDLNFEVSKKQVTEDTINNIIDTFLTFFQVKDKEECEYLRTSILKYKKQEN